MAKPLLKHGLLMMCCKNAVRSVVAAIVVTALWTGLAATPAGDRLGLASTVWADDGDDGDNGDNGDSGDDGDSDDGDNGGGASAGGRGGGSNAGRDGRNSRELRNRRQPAATRTQRQTQRAARPLPVRANREIVALGLDDGDIQLITDQGYTVLDVVSLPTGGDRLFRLQTPPGVTLEAARTAVETLDPQATVDFNHFYRTGEDPLADCQGPECTAAKLIAWPDRPGRRSECTGDTRIGLIDTGINIDHSTLRDSRLALVKFAAGDRAPSGRQHGTAVAAILLGSAQSRSPGLVPDADVIAVDAFYRSNAGDERSDVYTLVRALDYLAEQGASVINLSFSGPQNTLLEAMTQRLDDRDIVLVAAAGNAGPRADPLYPAAYPKVIAVTAVDRNSRIYRRAGRGAHIDLAAPGVEVWTAASVRGARPKTGTSFAAPFVTASVALAQTHLGLQGHDEIMAMLAEQAADLGEPGRDDVYGYGLVQAMGSCGPS